MMKKTWTKFFLMLLTAVLLLGMTNAALAATYYDVYGLTALHGQITRDRTYYEAGDTVTLTALPDAGYKLTTWEVTWRDDAGQKVEMESAQEVAETGATIYTFTMPASHIMVTARFTHTHDWQYALDAASSSPTTQVINATCQGCPERESETDDLVVTITLSAPTENLVYDNGNKKEATVESTNTEKLPKPAITYSRDGDNCNAGEVTASILLGTTEYSVTIRLPKRP